MKMSTATPRNHSVNTSYENEKKTDIYYFLDFRNQKITKLQHSQRNSVINNCDRHITHFGDLDMSFESRVSCYHPTGIRK